MRDRSQLRADIERLHGAGAVWVESVKVREEWEGQTVWDGVVEVFRLGGYTGATLCYAWEHETDDGRVRIVTVLHAPPVDSPVAAVRAAIAADHKRQ